MNSFKETTKHLLISFIVGILLASLSIGTIKYKVIPFLQNIVVPTLEKINKSQFYSWTFYGFLSFLFTFIIISLPKHWERYKRYKAKAEIAKGAFLSYYNPNSNIYHVKSAENRLKETANNSVSICIAGASGAKTFGEDDSPLKGVLKHCAHINIMLLHPFGKGIKTRVRSLLAAKASNYTPEVLEKELTNYREEIKKSVRALKQVYDIGQVDVSLCFYDEEPLLKIIIIDHNLIWFQHYEAGKHVRITPSYFLEKDKEFQGSGLFKAFLDIFERKWAYVREHPYNFDTMQIYNDSVQIYEDFS